MSATKKHYPLGLVLGKFMPPHLGHRVVIQSALAHSDRVVLVLCRQADDPQAANLRVDWLRRLYPSATINVMDVTWPITDDASWAAGVLTSVGEKPSVIFSSDIYAERLASLFGCEHVMVDRERKQVPISASQIRLDPVKYQAFLDPLVYEYFRTESSHQV